MKGPEVGYVDILDIETYRASEKEEFAVQEGGTTPYNPLRPSSSGKCTRELAYSLMEFTGQAYYPKEVREPNITRLLSIGHAIEADFIAHFRRHLPEDIKVKHEQQGVYGFDVTSEEYPELNHLVDGSLDLCFFSPDTRGLIDIKSKKDKFHRFHKSDWSSKIILNSFTALKTTI